MDSSNSLTDRIRGWFERSPKAQRVYERLSADLDTVVERVDSATSGLRDRIAPIIDPHSEPAAQDDQAAMLAGETTSEPAAQDKQDAALAGETASETEQGEPRG
jgi:hypothetical protein